MSPRPTKEKTVVSTTFEGREITSEVVQNDAQNRIVRTAGQSGAAAATVIAGVWMAQQLGWHGEMSNEVFGAFVILLTTVAAWVTNLKRLKGQP